MTPSHWTHYIKTFLRTWHFDNAWLCTYVASVILQYINQWAINRVRVSNWSMLLHDVTGNLVSGGGNLHMYVTYMCTCIHRTGHLPHVKFLFFGNTHVHVRVCMCRHSATNTGIPYTCTILEWSTHHSLCHMCWDLLLSQVALSQCHDDHLHWRSGEQSSGPVMNSRVIMTLYRLTVLPRISGRQRG